MESQRLIDRFLHRPAEKFDQSLKIDGMFRFVFRQDGRENSPGIQLDLFVVVLHQFQDQRRDVFLAKIFLQLSGENQRVEIRNDRRQPGLSEFQSVH